MVVGGAARGGGGEAERGEAVRADVVGCLPWRFPEGGGGGAAGRMGRCQPCRGGWNEAEEDDSSVHCLPEWPSGRRAHAVKY